MSTYKPGEDEHRLKWDTVNQKKKNRLSNEIKAAIVIGSLALVGVTAYRTLGEGIAFLTALLEGSSTGGVLFIVVSVRLVISDRIKKERDKRKGPYLYR